MGESQYSRHFRSKIPKIRISKIHQKWSKLCSGEWTARESGVLGAVVRLFSTLSTNTSTQSRKCKSLCEKVSQSAIDHHYFQHSHFRSSTKLTDAVRRVACFTHNVSVLSFFSLRNVGNARFVPHDKTKLIFLENASRVFQTTWCRWRTQLSKTFRYFSWTDALQPEPTRRLTLRGLPFAQSSFFWPLLNKSTLSNNKNSVNEKRAPRPTLLFRLTEHHSADIAPWN